MDANREAESASNRDDAKLCRVLFVEDDPVAAKIMIQMMKRGGHEVTHVWNGLAAIEMLANEEFEILVTDFKMARLDGEELCRWVRSDLTIAHLPILVTTGSIDPVELAKFEDMSVEVLAKPVKTEDLLERIDFYASKSA